MSGAGQRAAHGRAAADYGNRAQIGVPPVRADRYDRATCLHDVFGGRATQCWQVDLCASRLTAAEIAAATGGAPAAGTGAPTRLYPLRVAEMTVNVTSAPR